MQAFIRHATLIMGGMAALSASRPGWAQAPEEFYKGKTIDFIIGYPPGGSNDLWGRLVGHHIGDHIPGRPTIVPKNVPGAGSFLAANQIFNALPKDGTVIGIAARPFRLTKSLERRACASRPPSSTGSVASIPW